MVKNHEACAYDPDNQQNLPRFHITLPFQLKQCDPTKKLVHQVDGKTAVPQAVHKRQSANNAASDLMRQVPGARRLCQNERLEATHPDDQVFVLLPKS